MDRLLHFFVASLCTIFFVYTHNILVPLKLSLTVQVSQLWVIWPPFTAGAGGSHLLCQSWISMWPCLSLKWQELPRFVFVGVPSSAAISPYLDWYCLLNKEPNGVLILSFTLFIHQGIYARHLLGNASAPKAAQFNQCVEPLAKVAMQLVQRLVAFRIWLIWINALLSELIYLDNEIWHSSAADVPCWIF